jgi:hypothetical protein
MPEMWAACPFMYSVAPTMFPKNCWAGEAMSWLSVRSKVYFMLSAVTKLLSGGENWKSLRIWNVYVS